MITEKDVKKWCKNVSEKEITNKKKMCVKNVKIVTSKKKRREKSE